MSTNQADPKLSGKFSKAEYKVPLEKLETWQALIQQACQLCAPQIEPFAGRLSHALFGQSEDASDSKLANTCFHGAQLLKNSTYTYYYLCTAALEKILKSEVKEFTHSDPSTRAVKSTEGEVEMSLVSYEEMELKLSYSRASRSLELAHAEPLAALNMRFASMLGLESVGVAQNPFRPEVFLRALNSAWCEFNPDTNSHALVLPLLSELVFDLAPVYHALNELLVVRGVLPDLQETYRMKRKQAGVDAERVGEAVKNEVARKLEQYFAGQSAGPEAHAAQHQQAVLASHGGSVSGAGSNTGISGGHQPYAFSTEATNFNPASSELFQYLAGVQKNMAIHQLVAGAQNAVRLSQIRQEMPNVFHTGVERHTFDLLSHVFDGVFGNQDIPDPIKDLIGLLQVPVLKAALMDKDFFFQDSHPARRLIELLSKYSVSLDPEKGQEDPLFQAMQRNVIRVQKEFDQQLSLFDEVVNDLESFIQKDEAATIDALQAPINRAIQREKFKQASIAATHEVSLRIGTGEVLAFVETFLENRWTKVLTLAYSVREEKPHAVEDAIKTMDDLIWSIKPKITLAQRQEMINRLPGILARLNKWLSLIKWEDADRVQFFADLAECHASIVRAPLELTPERQMEIAVEAAKIATERRLEKRAKAEAEAKAKAEAEEAEKARLVAMAIEKEKAKAQAPAKSSSQTSAGEGTGVGAGTGVGSGAGSGVGINTGAVTTEASGTVTHLAGTAVDNSPVAGLSSATSSTTPIEGAVPSTGLAETALAPVNEESIIAKVEKAIEDAESLVASLERGMWVQFEKRDGTHQKVRLAWVSPMRSLFIFTSSQKEKSFSVAVDELERNFREARAQIVSVDNVVDKALLDALNKPVAAVSEPEIATVS
ncbi:DUF1631 family protein [Undibacterium sp. LX40W]|uniref:DUF1631 family protein n=1 Tax=Undibacterium nitidum TaxID=2762298 RepID=A0A923HP45_9BURK|nr:MULTISPECIES: DUF1631 family protein [Undibacterium]MBC3881391.1 DUF1631 family protein [Undibacterium nitidum]MBC3891826.1 DUF1631 family protein [Undibacterium sp. LX40W]